METQNLSQEKLSETNRVSYRRPTKIFAIRVLFNLQKITEIIFLCWPYVISFFLLRHGYDQFKSTSTLTKIHLMANSLRKRNPTFFLFHIPRCALVLFLLIKVSESQKPSTMPGNFINIYCCLPCFSRRST